MEEEVEERGGDGRRGRDREGAKRRKEGHGGGREVITCSCDQSSSSHEGELLSKAF